MCSNRVSNLFDDTLRSPHFWRGTWLPPVGTLISQINLRITAEEVQVLKIGRILI